MPPVKGKRVSSSRSKANPVAAVEAAPSFLPTKSGTPMRSPVRSPTKRQGMITQAQKQALIDNLQLEGMYDLRDPVADDLTINSNGTSQKTTRSIRIASSRASNKTRD